MSQHEESSATAKTPGMGIVRMLGTLVPASRRAEWIAEWEGELHHDWAVARAQGRDSFVRRSAMAARALGAVPDALWLHRHLTEDTMMASDLRHAARTLARRPGFSTVVILTLALGIGATTAIFSVVNAVLLRSLPFTEPHRLIAVRGVPTDGDISKVAPAQSYPDYADFRAAAESYEETAAYSTWVFTLTGPRSEPTPLHIAMATAGLFRTLGVAPALGRGLVEQDERLGEERVAVVSHAMWSAMLGGDTTRLGTSIVLDGVQHTIVGVMPPQFDFPDPTQVWIAFTPTGADLERGVHRLRIIGRLRDGVTAETAQREAERIFRGLEGQYPATNLKRTARVEPMGEAAVRGIRPILVVLFGAVVLVLLIVCTNVASLFLASAAAREREVAVRMALGAGRARIARQFVAESVLLALVGGGLGLVLAVWGVGALVARAPTSIPRADEIGIDLTVLGFVLGVSMLTGILFGVIPALHAGRVDASGPLKDSAASVTAGRAKRRVRQALVVLEVSLAMVLVIGAALLLWSLERLQRVDPGFDPERLVVARIQLPVPRYPQWQGVLRYYDQVMTRVAAVPGVRSAALAYEHPMSPGWTTSFGIVGREAPPLGQEPEAYVRPVVPGYFQTAGVRLTRGRDIAPHDRAGSAGAVVINEAFARQHFPDVDPIGQRLNRAQWWPEMPGSYEIVGVVRDERFLGLSEPAAPATYFPHAQFPMNDMWVVVKGEGDPTPLVPLLRDAIWSVDRDIPLNNVQTMDALLGGTLARHRFISTLLGLFAAAALLLAALGIYGVLSYTVTQRTPEIGIRMALGAPRALVLRSVVGQGMLLAAIGIVVGAGAAVALTRVLEGLLFGIEPTDLLVFTGVAILLGATALVATYLPARRASRVDPLIALRQG